MQRLVCGQAGQSGQQTPGIDINGPRRCCFEPKETTMNALARSFVHCTRYRYFIHMMASFMPDLVING